MSPIPPAPNIPASAVIDMTDITARVYPLTRDGSVSGIMTLVMIWKFVLPSALAASILPFSISRRLDSTILAYIGMQLAAIAIMHAFVP